MFNSDLTVRVHNNNGYDRVCSNKFIWQLLSLGFDFGKDHNTELILERVIGNEN